MFRTCTPSKLSLILRSLIVTVIFTIFISQQALAARKALVIGVSNYDHAGKLNNPVNDANSIAKALTELGFDVKKYPDLKHMQFNEVARKFVHSLQKNDVAVFYYAGHGVQWEDKNFLLPSDAKVEQKYDVEFASFNFRPLAYWMGMRAQTNLIILDACRNDPFDVSGLKRGFVPVPRIDLPAGDVYEANYDAKDKPIGGTRVVFSTQPGKLALDGSGTNSPFTLALLKHIKTPGLSVSALMKEVEGELQLLTNKQQRIWQDGSELHGFSFSPSTGKKTKRTSRRTNRCTKAIDDILWKMIDKSHKPNLDSYLQTCPNGAHKIDANKMLDNLSKPPEKHPVAKRQIVASIAKITRSIAARSTRRIDKRHFLGCFRNSFKKELTRARLNSFQTFFDVWGEDEKRTDLRQLAYAMGTAYYETGARMIPQHEGLCTDIVCTAKKLQKWAKKRSAIGRYARTILKPDPVTQKLYYGRGLVHLTKAAMYKRVGKTIGVDDALYRNPHLALDPLIATRILLTGMEKGVFTSRKLSKYFGKGPAKWFDARAVVAGDKKSKRGYINNRQVGEYVAAKSKMFHACLKLK